VQDLHGHGTHTAGGMRTTVPGRSRPALRNRLPGANVYRQGAHQFRFGNSGPGSRGHELGDS
jgi:hypothetical protein